MCGSLLSRQGRPREGAVCYGWKTDTFEIVVGEKETLAKFLLDNGGEGTERRGADGCVSLLWREASGTRRVMARDLCIVVGELETLGFFKKWYVLKDTPTRRVSPLYTRA